MHLERRVLLRKGNSGTENEKVIKSLGEKGIKYWISSEKSGLSFPIISEGMTDYYGLKALEYLNWG